MNVQDSAITKGDDSAISSEDRMNVEADGLSAQLLAADEEEERGERMEQTRQEYEALVASYRTKAAAKEQAQEQIAAAWETRHQPRMLGLRRIHWQQPAPLCQGLRTSLGRAMRHWETKEGHLLLRVRLAEARLLPTLGAEDGEDREEVNSFLAEALGISEAVREGWLRGHSVCWQKTGRWPRKPVSVRLFWPGGKAQGERLLGTYGPVLEEMEREAGQRQLVHLMGDRRIGEPAPLPPRR